MGHMETAVRILAMLAKAGGGCSTFEERLDVLLQAHYFLGRMASTVAETVVWGRCHRLYEEAVPEGAERTNTPFEQWWHTSGKQGKGGRARLTRRWQVRHFAHISVWLRRGRKLSGRLEHDGRTATSRAAGAPR